MPKDFILSVIIPVYNEVENIEKLLNEVKSVDVNKEIIIVDDFSTDGTREYLKKLTGVKVIFHEKNKGKGAAIRSGLQYATGDLVIIQDADLEYSPADYPKLIEPIITGKTKVVYGSRILGKGKFLKKSYFANRFLTLLTNLFFKGHITDMETCYKMIDRNLMQSLNLVSSRFEIEPEITCKLLRKGVKIFEVPISYQGRTVGKKIGVKDGIQAIWNIVKWKIKR
ncbi:MAG: glycosyltransferase family 2 protein [candidate division WOR-3 bacterium]|nr:glycosyltransferase family 2 protein [candidate division WOR-3 bacterium]